MALIAVPVQLLAPPGRVLGTAYTGPYGHAVMLAAPVSPSVDYRHPHPETQTGVVYGTTEVHGTPNAPLRARVRLMRERDGLPVRETWSHPTTGVWRFERVDMQEVYTVLTYPPARDHRAVVADGLIPEAMP